MNSDVETTLNSGALAKSGSTSQRGVRWKHVFKYQSHGAWVVFIAAAVVLGVAHMIAEPKYKRPVNLNDATIGLPMEPETVPMSWAVAFPSTALIVTMLVTEFIILHNKQSLTQALQAFFHVFWMALVGFAVVLAVTEVTKPVASRYRPDFLQRCTGQFAPVSRDGDTFILPEECKKLDPEALADGKKSFPSGHSSNTMSICWYSVLYLMHALFVRDGFLHMGGLGAKANSSKGSFLWHFLVQLLQGFCLLWACLVLCIAWWIGVSRYTDHRHNIDDITGGFIAALLWMTPIAIASMAQLTYFHKVMTAAATTEDSSDMQLPITNIAVKDTAASATLGTAAPAAEHIYTRPATREANGNHHGLMTGHPSHTPPVWTSLGDGGAGIRSGVANGPRDQTAAAAPAPGGAYNSTRSLPADAGLSTRAVQQQK